MDTIDPAHFREVLGQYPTGVCVVTAIGIGGQPVGMAVGTFTSVSLDPPLVAFLPDKRSNSWTKIQAAGTFCVNVLGAEQEPLCRIFASKNVDKFEGLRWRPSPSGSPVLEGAIAWIDCVLDVAHEAGDHHIVVGRVLDLAVEDQALPLLFYRGGYGQFTPQSFVTLDTDILDRLATVDLVRPAMEALAEDLRVDCVASLRVGEECVFVARAGVRGEHRSGTYVGRRVPCRPPVGGPLMAWASRAEQDAWIARAGDGTGWTSEFGHLILDRIRARGYVLGVGHDTYDDLWATLLAAGTAPPSADLSARIDGLRENWGQETIDADAEYEVGILTAPVFGPDGAPFLQFTLLGLPAHLSGREVQVAADRLLAACAAASAAAGAPFEAGLLAAATG